ncbi:MAG: carboxypeptidase regulatory-like domain-containing protein [Acidobacteriota bacterium]|nr:carboxypeptidase regulatory-like domain-containing protein [Acidobacteriota bacterium]
MAAGAGAQAPATAAVPAPATASAQASGGTVHGSVQAGTVPLPGVALTATNTLTGKRYATTTDITGSYAMAVPRNGRYVIRAELAAFAPVTTEVLINAAGQNGGQPDQVANFTLQLASRVVLQPDSDAAPTATAGERNSNRGPGLQALSLSGGAADLADASAGTSISGVQMPSLAGAEGSDNLLATDSVTVRGANGQTNGLAGISQDDLQQRIQDVQALAQRMGFNANDVSNAIAGALGGLMQGGGFGGGFGGDFGGPRGGFGGRGGGLGGMRGLNPSQPHGSFGYTGAYSALNANSFSVTGTPIPKPAANRNSFVASLTGSPYLPGLTRPNPKQFLFLSAQQTRSTTPTSTQLIVPTAAQRLGDLTGAGTVYDPATGQPYGATRCSSALAALDASPTACLPQTELSAAGQALLSYYPLPNVASTGTADNYQANTIATAHSTQISARFNRSFGSSPAGFGGLAGFGGFGGGRRQQPSQNTPPSLRQSISESFSYSHAASDAQSFAPQLSGKSMSEGYNLSSGYTLGYGRFNNTATLAWNRSRSTSTNLFTNTAMNPAVQAGVLVGDPSIYGNPFYYGVPTISLSGGIAALSDTTPGDRINQTISFSDFVSWNHKKHNLRLGFDFRRIHADSIGGTNVLGAFTFSGYATENPAQQACQPTTTQSCNFALSGSPIADLLLGLPQQTAVQAGLNKIYLRANAWDYFVQDDFRVLPSLTLNTGLRWEYFSPYSEKYDRLTNLQQTGDFATITQVCASPATGCIVASPSSLVRPDHAMYAPRLGLAWRPKFLKDTVLRTGYGINYNTGQYATFAQKLALQQPFALTQTNTLSSAASPTSCTTANMTLASGFGCSTTITQSNFGVNPDYRLGMVQVWSLDLQRSLRAGVVLNLGYNGSLGGHLDVVRAPNRTATGVLNPNAGQFNYEDSLAFSRQNALTLNARKRMQKGIALQATYTYGHSIDNASSIGGSGNSVAQDDRNLGAEESNSSFDVRHSLSGNWVFELPFGPNRAFLSKGGLWSRLLDGYSLSGTYTFATGNYATPVYAGTAAEVASGAGSSLRPDLVAGQAIRGAGTLRSWFNTAAFRVPAPGTYGTASRNSIQLPGTVSVNSSLSRTVELGDTRSFEARVSANNVFNTVQYAGVGTTINAPTFGQVTSAAAMRSLTFVARFRF